MIVKTKPSEYDLFVSYGRLTKQLLQEIFKLSRYPDDENTVVAFVTPPRAYAKYLIPMINGGNINPTVTFYNEAPEYIENENMGGYYNERKLQPDGTYKLVPAPLIYRLHYKVYINTATPMDADKLQYQLLSYCRKNKPAVKYHEGQWIEWYATNPTDEAPVEPGLEDKIAKRGCDLYIRRAYLPVDYFTAESIDEINAKMEIDDEIQNPYQYGVGYFGNTNDRGTPPTDLNLYKYGDVINVEENTNLEKDGYGFNGWSTAPVEPEV